MRVAAKVTAGALAAGAVVLGLGAPAGAKGPTGVTIQVPGGEPEALPAAPGTGGGHDERLLLLAEDMGLWQAIDPQGALPADPPAAAVGPGFRVAWSLVGPSGDVPLVQTLHPQAQGGPLVHTEPDQIAYGHTVPGGWYRAAPRLADTLASLGWRTKMAAPGGSAGAPDGSDGATVGGAGASVDVTDGATVGEAGAGVDATERVTVGGAGDPAGWHGRVAVAGGALAAVTIAVGVPASRRRRRAVGRRDAVPAPG
ncbi:MAG TPA: hypothetical protein VFZ77_19650 [Acidimicrobiales bacterium]